MKKLFLLMLVLIPFPFFAAGRFDTIDDLERFVQTLPENPQADNDDWVDPDFTSFYKSLEPNFFKSMFIDIGLMELPFDIMRLREPLKRAIKSARHKITERPFMRT